MVTLFFFLHKKRISPGHCRKGRDGSIIEFGAEEAAAAETLIGLLKAQPRRFIGGKHLHTPDH